MRANTVPLVDRPGSRAAVAATTAAQGRARPTVALVGPTAVDAGRQRVVALLRRLATTWPDAGASGLGDHELLDPEVVATLAGRRPRPGLDAPTSDRCPARLALDASPIELAAADRAARWPLLDGPGASVDWDGTAGTASALRTDLTRAIGVLRRTQPSLHRALEDVTRLVVTFTGDDPGSFAALAAHGAVFLNCRPGDGLPYAVEELAHQGGHVLLATMLFGREDEPFVVRAGTPFTPTDRDEVEDRTILVLLHAVFTESLMVASLWAAVDDAALTAEESHEVRGRLELALRRFRHDLVDLLTADVLSSSGLLLVARCRRVFELAVDGWARRAAPCDLTGQPYAFCRRTYLDRNPLYTTDPHRTDPDRPPVAVLL